MDEAGFTCLQHCNYLLTCPNAVRYSLLLTAFYHWQLESKRYQHVTLYSSLTECSSHNRPFYSCVLSFQAFDLEWGWRWPSCDIDQYLFSILQTSLHLKGSKVCIMIRSPLASLLFKGLATKHATVNWTIQTPSPKNSGNCTNLSAGPKVLPRCNIKLHVP